MAALSMALAATVSFAQQTTSANAATSTGSAPNRVKVYAAGRDVTAPVLLPVSLPVSETSDCKVKVDGEVELAMLVDTEGVPRNLMFVRPLGTDLDKYALRIAASDRFRPGSRNGQPVVVGQSVRLKLQTCIVEGEDAAGNRTVSLRLRSQPTQSFNPLAKVSPEAVLAGESSEPVSAPASAAVHRIGGHVTAPVPLNTIEAQYTPEATKAKITGVCLVALMVDRQGLPQNLRVVKSLDPGLDKNAISSVSRYRFKPAMRDGEPVSVLINIEVIYRLYE